MNILAFINTQITPTSENENKLHKRTKMGITEVVQTLEYKLPIEFRKTMKSKLITESHSNRKSQHTSQRL